MPFTPAECEPISIMITPFHIYYIDGLECLSINRKIFLAKSGGMFDNLFLGRGISW